MQPLPWTALYGNGDGDVVSTVDSALYLSPRKKFQAYTFYITTQQVETAHTRARKQNSKPIAWPAQTFAAVVPIVFPARWAIAACSATFRVSALAFAVASAVILQALVHIYTNK